MAQPSIVLDQCIEALASALEAVNSGVEIIRGNQNRVPLPKGDFLLLTELSSEPVETPHYSWKYPEDLMNITQPYKVAVQCDVYGHNALDRASALVAVLTSVVGSYPFPQNIQLLHTEDLRQATFVDESDQFLERWIFTVHLQYNPSVEFGMEYAEVLSSTNHRGDP